MGNGHRFERQSGIVKRSNFEIPYLGRNLQNYVHKAIYVSTQHHKAIYVRLRFGTLL